MTKILDELIVPKVLMNRGKLKAVLVPYVLFKSMELALEDQMDEILVKIAEKKLSDTVTKYKSHQEFWSDMDIE